MYRKKRLTFFLLCILLITVQAVSQSNDLRFTFIPEVPVPGEPVTIAISGNIRHAVLFKDGRQLTRAPFVFIPPENGMPAFYVATLTIPHTATAGSASIRLQNGNNVVREFPLTIGPREFVTQTINITPTLNTVLNAPDPQRAPQAERLWAVLTTTGTEYYHTGPFSPPVTSTRRTGFFATRRVNRYPDGRTTTWTHEGVDFGVPTGTPVFACGTGRVALAESRIVTGNSIVIEHGPGIYSLYFHLDKIEVEVGQIVNMGDQIALSGSTGFSTGPHLHWDIRVNAEFTDPDILLERPLLDKNLIIDRLFFSNGR